MLTEHQRDLRDRGQVLRFRDLTEGQVELLCNGCGGKGGWFNPPEYLFNASCDHHDFNYWLGYTEKARREADEQFFKAMLQDAGKASWFSRWWLKGAARRYYWAVRFLGKKFFNYCERERSWEELEQTLTKAKMDAKE